jgi:mitochondrial enoyl-[acyl-carrier protein] reductase / trans-2-enoyl-CoA reductase
VVSIVVGLWHKPHYVSISLASCQPIGLPILTPPTGTWRSVAKLKASDLLKVPSTLPVEYAASLGSPLTASALLGGAQPGDYVIQNGASSAVGLSVVQIAKSRGIHTINVLAAGPGYFEKADLVKKLGGDIVVTDEYLASPAYAKLTAELPKPKLGLDGVGGGATAALAKVGASVITYKEGVKGGAKTWYLGDWMAKATAQEKAAAVEAVTTLMAHGGLSLWVERHPLSDIKYAIQQAQDPYKSRQVVLMINEPPTDAGLTLSAAAVKELQADFETAFKKLRV